jgi:putative peptidoglycan lipid II flippase
MKKTATVLMVITILSKVMGFAREMSLGYFYGTGAITDAFLIAFTIPGVLFNFVSNGVTTGYIPMFTRIESEEGREKAHRFTANLTNILLIIALIVCVIGLVFTEPIVRIFAAGYTGERLQYTVYFTRFMMFSVFAIGTSSVFRGYLNQHGSFVVPASTGFIMNFFTIGAIILSARFHNLRYLAIGGVAAQIIQYIAFPAAAKKSGYTHSAVLDFSDKHVRAIVMLALPIIVGVAVQDINRIVDNSLASIIMEEGGVTILTFANRMVGFVSGIVIISITTAIYPTLSRLANQRKITEMKDTFRQSMSMMNLLVFPAVTGLMIFSTPIVNLLFGRGKFGPEAVVLTGSALTFNAPSLLGMSIREVLARMFYSLRDTRTPAVNAVITVILNITFSVALSFFIGLNGLALGTTIATILGAVLLFYVLRVRLRGLSLTRLIGSTVKILVASVLMGLAGYAFYRFMAGSIGDNLRLLLSIVISAGVYGVLILLLRVEEARQMLDLVQARIRRK